MGIQGLTSFLRENKRTLSKTLHFSARDTERTSLVVDGWSFIYSLIHDSNLPWVYGGEYDELAQLVVKVVQAWLAVGLRPIFVFDGSTPFNKFATVISRLNESCVQHALLYFRTSVASRNTRRFLNEARIIPPLAYTVCVHALLSFRFSSSEDCFELSERGKDNQDPENRLEIHFADEECDPYAVELAGRVEGYITGQDSDFVVLNSEGYRGYIPLSELVWLTSDSEEHGVLNDTADGFQPTKSKKKLVSEKVTGLGVIPPDSQDLSLSATLYTPACLAHQLNLPVSLLPLLGALVGNDFTLQASFPAPSTSSASPSTSKSLHRLLFERRLTSTQRILHASATLGTFLRPSPGKRKQNVPQSVMELIQMTVSALLASSFAPASLTGSDQQAVIVESVVEGTLPYAIPVRPAKDMVLSDAVCALHTPSECQLVSLLEREDLDLDRPARAAEIATLYLRAYRLGKFSPSLMDVLSTRSFWPKLFLENPDAETVARSVSRPVRKLGYALLEDGIRFLNAEDKDGSEDEVEDAPKDETVSEEDLDEVIDVVEEPESEYEFDIVADVGKLRGALRSLQLEENENTEDDESDRNGGSVAEGEASNQSSSTSVRSRVPLSRPSCLRKLVSSRRKVVVEYVRRGARVVPEEVEVPVLRRTPSSSTDWINDDEPLPLQLQSESARLDGLYRFLQVSPQTIDAIDRRDLMPALALQLVVRRMHERAMEAKDSKERQLERWTRKEARAFLASLALPRSTSSADPPTDVSERAIQLTAQLSTALECIEHFVQILLLTDAVPGCAHRFSGLRFHLLLAAGASREADVDESLWRATEAGLEECFAEERTEKKAKRKAQKSAAASAMASANVHGSGKKPGAGGLYGLLADMSM